ncbi:diacylglycerol acyltransferase-domain-containing protein [Phlyctochytrium arcticum]|nr:diacylglycerol acyltransferase-domain-containing protein [Phlyctochytrium arcticum]
MHSESALRLSRPSTPGDKPMHSTTTTRPIYVEQLSKDNMLHAYVLRPVEQVKAMIRTILQVIAVTTLLSQLVILPIVLYIVYLSPYVLGPLFVIYVVWFMFFDEQPWRGGEKRVSKNWRNKFYLPASIREYLSLKLHKEVELDPKEGPYLMCMHPHGLICHSHFVNILTDVTGFDKLFPGIDRRIATVNVSFYLPVIREIALMQGLISVEKKSLTYFLGKGPDKAVGIVVGGASESLECFEGTNRIVLRRRKGVFKLALETGASLVPVYGFGETSLWHQVRHPFLHKVQCKMHKLWGFTIPIMYGRWGTIVPKKHRVTTVVGKPVKVTKIANPTIEQIDALQAVYIQALEDLYHRHKDEYDKARVEDLRIIS